MPIVLPRTGPSTCPNGPRLATINEYGASTTPAAGVYRGTIGGTIAILGAIIGGTIMVGIAVVGSVVAAFVGALPLAADPPTPPPAGPVVIDVVTVNGSGCPPGTVAVSVTQDNTAFAIDYNVLGPAPAPPTDTRRPCSLDLVLHAPRGYAYAIQEVEYTGFASLAPRAVGRHRAGFGFGGTPLPAPPHTTIHLVDGPFSDDWRATDTIDAASLVFAPCDRLRPLAVTGTVDVTPVGSNLMTLDRATYRLTWRRCPTA